VRIIPKQHIGPTSLRRRWDYPRFTKTRGHLCSWSKILRTGLLPFSECKLTNASAPYTSINLTLIPNSPADKADRQQKSHSLAMQDVVWVWFSDSVPNTSI